MDYLIPLLKYGFVIALAVEATLVGRALLRLAVEKARAAEAPASQE
jgi:hypothetical protein